MPKQVSVVIPAHLSHTGSARRCDKPIDIEVADLVERLNHPANGDEPITTASCGGHDTAPPTITMMDGGTLVVAQTPGDVAVMALALGFSVGRDWKRFRLVRHIDVTGISGTGHVADGWLIEAVAVVRWRGVVNPTTTIHHGGMESVEAIHGHVGKTVVEWVE